MSFAFYKQVLIAFLHKCTQIKCENFRTQKSLVLVSILRQPCQHYVKSFLFVLELPSLLPIVDVAEALLHVRNGDWFLCLLVANVPDSFNEGNSAIAQHCTCWQLII